MCNSHLHSQELVNDTNGKIKNNGTIKFNSSSAKLTNNNSNPISDSKILNPGTIEFSGSVSDAVFDGSDIIGDNGQRIPGLVKYSYSSGSITLVGIGNDTYYTNLSLSGGSSKTLNDGIYISGTYTISGGDRDYLGTFFYDGSETQTITGENATSGDVNIYNNLSLLGGGQKNVNSGSSNYVYIKNSLNTSSDTDIQCKGTIIIGQNSPATASVIDGNIIIDGDNGASVIGASLIVKNSQSTFNGNINIRNGGNDDAKFIMDGTADVSINSDLRVENTGGLVSVNEDAGELTIRETGNITLENNTNSKISLADGTVLNIFGSYNNNFISTYANASYNNSTVYYRHLTNDQDITPTSSANPYGNIVFLGTETKTATSDFFINGNISISGGNVDMYASGDDNTLTVQSSCANITYNNNEEIIGKMKRVIDSDNNSYKFNNNNTSVLFTSATSTFPDDMTFSVRPGVSPEKYSATTDIQRKIIISYALPTSQFTMTLKSQYRDEELFSGSYNQTTLRFMEATTLSAVPEKLSTGETRTVTASTGANTIGHILLPGVLSGTGTLPNNLDIFASGNDLLMRSGPAAIYAISNGRWSNPLTWDEGNEPESDDNVIIDGFTVHAGFIRSSDGYEVDESTPTALAQEITIGSSDYSSLLFGSTDILGTTPLFKLSTNGIITNRGIFSSGFPDNDSEDTGSTLYKGLIIYDGSSLLVNDLLNDGTLSNGGHLEIGDE